MMKLITLLAGLLLGSTAFSQEIAGIEMPDKITTTADTELQLNGAGVRTKWFMDLYVSGLYLQGTETDAEAILSADEAMAIRLHMVSGLITSEKMTEATLEGFENATHGETAPLQAEIDQLLSAFGVPIEKGDIFEFVYAPGTGIQIIKNGNVAQTISSDNAFKRAFFGIWISDKPAQKSLKYEMLGQKV